MTISGIAKVAGVASKAVSRYFNNGYLSEDKRAVIETVFADKPVISGFSIESVYEKTQELLKKCPDLDALICATHKMAIGVVHCLREKGKKIPEDVMVAGHGDLTLSVVSEPMLTTVLYYEDSGTTAARIVLEMFGKSGMTVKELKLGYQLVIWESTGTM